MAFHRCSPPEGLRASWRCPDCGDWWRYYRLYDKRRTSVEWTEDV